MLYYLSLLQDLFSPLRVFRYITFRGVCAAGTAFLFCLFTGEWMIGKLRQFKISQYIRKEEAPPLYELHGKKEGTPTMGGLLIIASTMVSVLLWTELTNFYVWISVATMIFMGLIGFWDDYLKLKYHNAVGLKGRWKFLFQVIWAVVVAQVLLWNHETRQRACEIMIPFLKDPVLAGIGIIGAFVFIALIITGATNSVNLTDGLDGLAIGCCASVVFSYFVMTYAAGHYQFADYLRIPFIKGVGELSVLCGGLLGSCLGFLWFNCHPAKIFMGDTGSLALGGIIAMIAILIKQELVLIILGGVFVMEAASVIIQVASFKLRGKRVFAMAPIHHHFELRKWSETQVTVRFWILSIVFSLLGILSLKLR